MNMEKEFAELESSRPDAARASEFVGPAPPVGARRDQRQDTVWEAGAQREVDAAIIAYTGHSPDPDQVVDKHQVEALGHS